LPATNREQQRVPDGNNPADGFVEANNGFFCGTTHRNMSSSLPNEDIPKLRPRHVDAEIFRKEREGWRKWHENQTKAEEELVSE
jgi:hypothetical protein